ncbi:MAG TPA: NAD(P)H-dependent oxidoreductase [Mesorhizobium sp.]|nr:NAD(P)H-dependent oxidoreductase [Mesorhizobium sp.]
MMPKILVFAGSIRTNAYSGKTADVAQKALALHGADVTRISLADYPLPLMDEDLEKEEGIPDNAMRLGRLLAAQDGFLLASPEYNASIPPLLKNTLDWLSRIRRDGDRPLKPFDNKAAALCSSSNGNFAGIRCLYHLRAVVMACGAEVITPQFSVARGAEAFDENGNLVEERLRKTMDKVAATLAERARLLSARAEP